MDDRLRNELIRDIREFLDEGWSIADAVAEPAPLAITDRQLRVATAILMVWVLRADGTSRQDEHRSLETAIARVLGIGPGEAAVVVRGAEQAVETGVPFAAVVSRLARDCSREQRLFLVESLWRIAFSDAELGAHEEYLVRKIAHLFALTADELAACRERAREAFLREGR